MSVNCIKNKFIKNAFQFRSLSETTFFYETKLYLDENLFNASVLEKFFFSNLNLLDIEYRNAAQKIFRISKEKTRLILSENIIPCLFSFPSNKKPYLLIIWVKFVNRKDWKPTKNSRICFKHFDEKCLKTGVRTTFRCKLNPIPSISLDSKNIPSLLLPSASASKKLPTRRTTTLPVRLNEFKEKPNWQEFLSITT